MPGSARRSTLAALLAALALAGCGGDSDGEDDSAATVPEQPASTAPRILSAEEMAVVQRARDEVGAHCRAVAEALAAGTAPSPASFDRATAALDELTGLAEEQPEAAGPDGTTPRLALGDIAEDLEGTNCDSRLVARIDEALAGLPPG